MAIVDERQGVWVLLIERGLDAGSDLRLFWHEVDAIEAGREYLSESYPAEELATAADVLEAIEAENQIMSGEAYIVLAPYPVDGNQYFEGTDDHRPRCRTCREPIELDDPDDPHSWVHCED